MENTKDKFVKKKNFFKILLSEICNFILTFKFKSLKKIHLFKLKKKKLKIKTDSVRIKYKKKQKKLKLRC